MLASGISSGDRWYHQKEAFVKHLSSKMQINVTEFMKSVNEGKSREVLMTKNQLCVAIGIMKTKSAAIQYEERIAELHAAGSDVRDFGHSRKLFPAMLSAACAYIGKKMSILFSTPLLSTGNASSHLYYSRQVHQPSSH